MEEIKVGEYVRTDNGIIGKYIEKQRMDYIDTGKQQIGFDIEKDIVKHSPNIIDLIEEGDYVNGKLIHKVDIRENSTYIYYGNSKTFVDYQIYSIVTKEQFEKISYKVEE